MNRSGTALLSDHELASLRLLAIDSGHYCLRAHRATLFEMGLIRLVAGRIEVTEAGCRRLIQAPRPEGPTVTMNNFLRPA